MRSNAVPDWSPAVGPNAAPSPADTAPKGPAPLPPSARAARVEQIVARHFDAIWRTARDLGVLPRDLDDVAQEVLVVCVRRLSDIEPERERAFLLATTSRVVANWRRTRRRRPAEPSDSIEELAQEHQGGRVRGPAELLEHKRELELVQAALDEMNEQQRVVFTLFELEELTAREIAEQLGLTESVVFARAQRARAVFQRCVARAREQRPPPRPAGPNGDSAKGRRG